MFFFVLVEKIRYVSRTSAVFFQTSEISKVTFARWDDLANTLSE